MRRSKKMLAIIMAIVAIFTAGRGCFQSLAADHCAYTPIIYIHGYRNLIATREDGSTYFPLDGDDDSEQTMNAVETLLPDLLKAIATNDYDDYCEKAYQEISKIYAPVAPNLDGTMPEGTGSWWSWSPETLSANHANTTYDYVYDTRYSPLDIADDLHAYIEAVKAKTGHDKVVLASRCVGTNIALAYLYKYERDNGYADVAKTVFVYGGLGGFSHLDHILSGTVQLTEEGVFYFAKSGFGGLRDFEGMGGSELGEFLFETLDLLRTTHGLNVTCELVNKIYDKVKDKFIARVLKDYYGVSLTQVSAITDYYEQYKNYVFQEPGDKEKYAYFINKADDFHYNVLSQRDAILKEMNDIGKPVYFIGDYGDQAAPISEEANYVGDAYATVSRQTLGATGSKVAGTLSRDYIKAQTAKGLDKYISPDKQVDASTCLFPDQTWFVKNLHHNVNVPGLYKMLYTLSYAADALTVETLPDYPQFLNCPDENCAKFVPAQEHNENDVDWGSYDKEAVNGTIGFFQKVIDYVTNLIKKIYYYVSMQWVVDMVKAN